MVNPITAGANPHASADSAYAPQANWDTKPITGPHLLLFPMSQIIMSDVADASQSIILPPNILSVPDNHNKRTSRCFLFFWVKFSLVLLCTYHKHTVLPIIDFVARPSQMYIS